MADVSPHHPDLIVEVDDEDYTRGIKGTDMVTQQEITNLRSIAGSGMGCTVLLSTLQCEGHGVMFDTGYQVTDAVEVARQNQNMTGV